MIKLLVDLKMENQERTNATSGKDVFLKNVWFKVFSIHYIVTHEMVNRFVFSSEYQFHFWYYSPYCSSLKLGFAIDLWSLFIIVNALYHVNFIKPMFELLTVVTILSPDSLKKRRSFETLRWMLCIFFISHNLWENDWKQISIKMWKHQVFTTLFDAMTSMNGDCFSALFCRLLIQWLIMTPRQSYFFVVFQRTLDQRHCSLMDCQRM